MAVKRGKISFDLTQELTPREGIAELIPVTLSVNKAFKALWWKLQFQEKPEATVHGGFND